MSEPRKIFSEEQIKERIRELGAELTKKFKTADGPSGAKTVSAGTALTAEPTVGLTAICVLNGSFMFYSDLIRSIDVDLTCEFLGVSSYKDQKVSTGEVKVTLDLEIPLQGKDIILIEDLVDSGLTMNYLINTLKARNPKSLTTVSLLLKPKALKVPCKVDYVGFEIGNDFVVGYGIDHAGQYRNLPYLAVLAN